MIPDTESKVGDILTDARENLNFPVTTDYGKRSFQILIFDFLVAILLRFVPCENSSRVCTLDCLKRQSCPKTFSAIGCKGPLFNRSQKTPLWFNGCRKSGPLTFGVSQFGL